MKNFLEKNWPHIAIWLGFILYETLVVGLVFGVFGDPLTYAAHYALIIIFFYTLALRSFPWAMSNTENAWWKFPLILTFSVSIFIVLSFITDKSLQSLKLIQAENLNFGRDYILRTLYRCVYFVGFSATYYFLRTFISERKKNQDLERQRLEAQIREEIYGRELEKAKNDTLKAQNDFLKAQINPHFLFNTLDYIYHTIRSDAEHAAEAVITLSEMMRYAIDASDEKDCIILGDEISQVRKFISLYQLRKNNELKIITDFDEKISDLNFLPLVLLTLVENIFKHGSLSVHSGETLISAKLTDGRLIIYTKNPLKINARTSGSQNGLKNIEQRLKFKYGSEVGFTTSASEHSFIVEIKVPLA